tara:strand:- start:60 stop:413 length:354 start_codon:yes stop_codon:yes gene_type:complete
MSCIIDSTSDRDKVILIRWMFVLLAEHPSLKKDFPITESKKIDADKAVADYMSYLIGQSCLVETKNVLDYEGEDAFLKAFEYLGEVAMTLLIEHEDVIRSFERYIQYIDPSIFEEFN